MEIKDILIKNAIKYRFEINREIELCEALGKELEESGIYRMYNAKWGALVETIREAGLWEEYIDCFMVELGRK